MQKRGAFPRSVSPVAQHGARNITTSKKYCDERSASGGRYEAERARAAAQLRSRAKTLPRESDRASRTTPSSYEGAVEGEWQGARLTRVRRGNAKMGMLGAEIIYCYYSNQTFLKS